MTVLSVLGFAAFWGFGCWIVSYMSGWQALARWYPCVTAPKRSRLYFQTGRIGWANYNNVLTLSASDDGLYLAVLPPWRPGHAPLTIPWSAIEGIEQGSFLWVKFTVVKVGAPTYQTIQLPDRIGDELRALWKMHSHGDGPCVHCGVLADARERCPECGALCHPECAPSCPVCGEAPRRAA